MKEQKEKPTGRTPKGRFAPGTSGNPAGMKPGTRKQATMMAERLMSSDIVGVVRAVVRAAKGGDMMAAKLILDRVAPLYRSVTDADERIRRLEKQLGMKVEEFGRIPQLIDNNAFDQQGETGTH